MRVTAHTKLATRQRILEVAKKLFAQQGFAATTTRDIAAAAEIGVGTLFNYFPTKESVVETFVNDASAQALEELTKSAACQPTAETAGSTANDAPSSLEEDLFALAAATLRKLKPYRKYLPAVLETTLSPLANEAVDGEQPSFRTGQLERVCTIAAAHDQHTSMTAVALHLYWTLFAGVLTFWAADRSPRQEDTLALLDESLSMFVGWLTAESNGAAQTYVASAKLNLRKV